MKEKDLKYYVRGNITFPFGVINRLILLGANPENPFSEADLANPYNIFYIDFYNDNLIRKVGEDSVIGNTILEFWKELQPITYIDEPESLPNSWDKAYEDCIEVKNYINGKNDILDNLLDKLGRCVVIRDIYRQGWTPKPNEFCYYIDYNLLEDDLEVVRGIKYNKVLSFQDLDLAMMYLNNFKNMIEECKELI